MRKFFFILVIFSLFVVSCDNLYNDVAEEKKDMQKLIFVNADGVSVDLTKDPYGITEWEGFSKVDLNLQTQQVPFHDGSVYLDGLLSERELSVTLAMNDEKNLEKRYRLRRELITILNPKLGEGTLIYINNYTSKQIKVIPQTPLFENHNSNDSGTPKASLAWTACDPYWEDLEETSVLLGIFEEKVIENNGDIPVSIKVDIFTNQSTNTGIENITTGKKIKSMGVITNTVGIDTAQGNKDIYIERYNQDINHVDMLGINDVIYVDSKSTYYAIGSGCCYISYDLINWDIFPICSHNLEKIIWIEDKQLFIAIGEGIYISSDAKSWNEKYYNDGDKLYAISYSELNNKYIVVGTRGTLNATGIYLTSSDCLNWNLFTLSKPCFDVICYDTEGLQHYICITAKDRFYQSTDLENWTEKLYTFTDSSDGKNVKIVYNPFSRVFILAFESSTLLNTRIFTGNSSFDSWTLKETVTYNLKSLYLSKDYNKTFLLFTVGNRYYLSEDDETWTSYSYGMRNLTECRLGFLYIDRNCSYYGSSGESWNSIGEYPYYELNDFVKNGENIVFVANNKTLVSNDIGKTFESSAIYNQNITCICYSPEKNLYIAGGFNGFLKKSNDGLNWSDIQMPLGYASIAKSVEWFPEAHVFVLFYLVNNGDNYAVFISEDGDNWSNTGFTINTDEGYFARFSYCNGKIFLGTSYNLYYSADAENWTVAVINSDHNALSVPSVIYSTDLNKYIAPCRYSVNANEYRVLVLTSENGETWNATVATGLQGTGTFIPSDIIYSPKIHQYFIFNETGKLMFTSFNGMDWKIEWMNTALQTIKALLMDNELNCFIMGRHSTQILSLEKDKSLISTLTHDSDMNLELIKGKNRMRVFNEDGDCLCRITYCQKYIGV